MRPAPHIGPACARWALALLASLVVAAWPGAPARADELPPEPGPRGLEHRVRDPLLPMLARLHRYFDGHLQDGITMDSRYPINPSEAIRMGVVCQLLGYAEIAKLDSGVLFRSEVQRHADFLVEKIDSVRSQTPFDGMLAYSFVEAYRQTGDPVHRDAAAAMLQEMEAFPTSECILNGGLMVALATADWANVSGDTIAAQKTHDILSQLTYYQNADGSFPHWCPGSEDIHYTGWMGFELVLIERMTHDPLIDPMLRRMWAFLDARVDGEGVAHYEEPCPDYPGCMRYYDSQHSGCGYDYDTRGITVEPAYEALVFDHFRAPSYRAAMRFLTTLENGGTFKDKYGWIPPPESPDYPWSTADTSVANMSINFWALATMLTGREDAVELARTWFGASPQAATAGAAPPQGVTLALDGGASGGAGARLRFTLPQPGRATLAVHDVAGRRLRVLADGPLGSGDHLASWDGTDASGAPCRPGVYFASLRTERQSSVVRIIMIR
jgi:hypothetical protein